MLVGGRKIGGARRAGGTTPATWATTAFCVHTCAARRGPRPPVCPAPPTLCGLQYKPRPHRVGVLRQTGGRVGVACQRHGRRAAGPSGRAGPRACVAGMPRHPPAQTPGRGAAPGQRGGRRRRHEQSALQYNQRRSRSRLRRSRAARDSSDSGVTRAREHAVTRRVTTPGHGAVPRRRGVERGSGLYRKTRIVCPARRRVCADTRK